MMITSAEEFARLRLSEDSAEQVRATHEAAEDTVWHAVISDYPNLKIWVVRNKTVPLDILRILSADANPRIRREVAGKRKIDRALFEALANDPDEGVRRAVLVNAKCPADIAPTVQAGLESENR